MFFALSTFLFLKKSMIKEDFIRSLIIKYNFNRAEAQKIVAVFFDCFREGLKQERKVMIMDFGLFHVLQKKQRTGRNPSSGEVYEIPPRLSVTFKSAKSYKKFLNREND